MGRKIILGEKAGCCFGVKRALEIAGATRGKYQGPVYTLGPLIHNPKVVKSMEEAGIVPCEDLEETEPGESCSSGRTGQGRKFSPPPGVAA